jgi:hypothetical protein
MLDNYYEQFPNRHAAEPARFPRNHVRYSALLRPLEWLNALHVRLGVSPLSTTQAALRVFDSAAPFDAVLGSADELADLRSALVLQQEGIDRNPYVSGIGRVLCKKLGLGLLETRRAVLAHYAANKDFIEANGRVRAPLIITGLPRTGSTLLQRLIAEDPNTRTPYTFELERPLPPLQRDVDPLRDPRIAEASTSLAILARIAPGFIEKLNESHLWSATEFEESFLYMLAHNGVGMIGAPIAGRKYVDALLSLRGKRPVLRYERLFFTMLDAYRPAASHWTFKAPNYAHVFPLVLEEYPDVRMVITHRNPLITLPSCCRLGESWNIAFDRDGSFDRHRFGELSAEIMNASMEVPFRYRQANPETTRQIFDCMYDELFADPIAMVKRIYTHFDLEVTESFVKGMQRYLAQNPQGKHGRHRYSLEDYGIDSELYYDRHRDYMRAYGFSIEGARTEQFGPRQKRGNRSVPAVIVPA